MTRNDASLLLAITATAATLAVWNSRPAAQTPSAIRFENVTDKAGLTTRLDQNPTADKNMVETMAGGLAVFDYDGDGLPDIFFTNGAKLPSLSKGGPEQWNRLFRNRGDMTFGDVTERAGVSGEGYSTGAAAADYDNDGHIDLFVAGINGNRLYRNRGDGTFADVTAASGIKNFTWSVAAGWFDYDNDGRLDLFVVNYVDWTPQRNKFCGDQGRGLRVYCHPKHYAGLPNVLYRNRGDGTFEDVSERSGIAQHIGKGMSVAFADYDDDGFTDVVVTNDAVPNFLFHNRRNGTFEEVGLLAGVAVPANGRPVSGMGVDFRDYDNDGRPDIVLTALSGETFPLFKNEKGAFFKDATYESGLAAATIRMSGWGAAFADLDNDGFKDLLTANSHANDRVEEFEASAYRQPNAVFRNVRGRFENASATAGDDFTMPRANRGIGIADFDRDGRLDVVISELGEAPRLLRNVTSAPNAWLSIRLVGTASNRDGIGARVRIGTQANDATSSVGYASSSLDGVHFGLGEMSAIDRVDIAWPNGIKQGLEHVATNQILTVTQPQR
jgi:enediyne biosynthesis protein E4